MFNYFKGKVAQINHEAVVIDIQGIGYEISTPNPELYSKDQAVTLYTESLIRSDHIVLYGFNSQEERTMFKRLLTVNGVGPKSALSLLTVPLQSLEEAINNEEHDFLTRFQGIGKSTSAKIIQAFKSGKAKNTSTINLDLVNTLTSMGYQKNEIEVAIKHLDHSLLLNEAILFCLKALNKVS